MIAGHTASTLNTSLAGRHIGLVPLCAFSGSAFGYYFYYPRAIRGGCALHGEA